MKVELLSEAFNAFKVFLMVINSDIFQIFTQRFAFTGTLTKCICTLLADLEGLKVMK